MSLKSTIRTVFRKLGVDIQRYDPSASPIISSLRKFEIDLVLDVGANQGQFAAYLRSGGYAGKIVSFEPLSEAHGKLSKASRGDADWVVCPRCALGDRDGEVEINIAGNSFSSSILPMLELHRSVAPGSAYQGKEVVSVRTLDAVAGQYMKNARAPFLKIDTQGFELQVLDGARDTLSKIRGVHLELSLVSLYEGQHLWQELMGRLDAEGFVLWAFEPVFSDPLDGRTLQVDGIFYRNP